MGDKMPFISCHTCGKWQQVDTFLCLRRWEIDSESHGLAMETSIYNRKWFRKSGKNETNYSEFIKFFRNTEHRRVASKFRIGNHNLKIETGRFTIPKTPEDLRICDHCNLNSAENELHILFHCDLYNDLRKTLFIKINDRNTLLFGLGPREIE